MRDTKVPPPALFSETLEKTRRNSLIWSGLAVAAELAQTDEHKLKSSIIGGDTTLPVAMIGLIFILLSAFHLYAFWFEKRRIERWQSQYATEHEGINLHARIYAFFTNLEGLILQTNSDNIAKISQISRIEDIGFKYDSELEDLLSYYRAINQRDREFHEALKTARHADEQGPQAVKAKWFELTKPRSLEKVNFEPLYDELRKLRELFSAQPGPDDVLRARLDKVTKQLTNLADDIDMSEKRYFRLYEVGSPLFAFGGAAALWLVSTIWPDFPVAVRNMFIRA